MIIHIPTPAAFAHNPEEDDPIVSIRSLKKADHKRFRELKEYYESIEKAKRGTKQ